VSLFLDEAIDACNSFVYRIRVQLNRDFHGIKDHGVL